MILSDLLETLQNQRAYPYAEIRRDHVHETETSDDFEAMNVQLRREIEYRNGTVCFFYFFFLFISIHLFFFYFGLQIHTREFMKIKYICIKVKIICNTGLTPCNI